MKKLLAFLILLSMAHTAYAGCSGSPANAACSQWNADQTNCQIYTNHANQCLYTAANCHGTPDCGTYGVGDPTTCNASPGGICAWTASCTGNVDCSGGSEAGCPGIAGGGACAWVPGADYDPGSCVAIDSACSHFAGDEGTCISIAGCSWTSQCNTQAGCSLYNADSTTCNSFPGCSYSSASCSGTMTCAAQTSQTSCTSLSCTWALGKAWGEVMQ